jgi:outer membrane protein assembly factor BamB
MLVNGIVYTHSSNGTLYAFDAFSGHQLWNAPVGDGLFSTPVVANHLVYIAAQNKAMSGSTVFALDAASGHTFWSVVEPTRIISQLAVADGLVYLAPVSAEAQVFTLDAFSGKTNWSVQLAGQSGGSTFRFVASPFQVVNGMAYVSFQGIDPNGPIVGKRTLYALDAQTGQVVWTAPTASQRPTIAHGLVYVYSGTAFYQHGGLTCVGAPCPSTPAPDAGNGTLSALDARTGRQQWSHPAVPLIDPFLTTAPEAAEALGLVYVWTTKNQQDTLYALNAISGREQWSYQTGGSFSTQLTVAQGMVYSSLYEKGRETVEAIQPPGGPPGFSR